MCIVDRRLILQAKLEEILGRKNVYYQPPENLRMQYPAIVYNLDDVEVNYADNLAYYRQRTYEVTLIIRDPDSGVTDKLLDLPYCSFSRTSVVDHLYHYYYSLSF